MSSRKNYDLEEFSRDETMFTDLDEALQENHLVGVGNHKSMLNQWNSKARHCSKKYSPFPDISTPEHISLSKEENTYATVGSAPSSCHRTSKETDTKSFSNKLTSEDERYDMFPVPKLHPATNLTHTRAKSKGPVEHESANRFMYKNDILRKLSSPDVRLWNPTTLPLEPTVRLPNSYCAGDFQKDTLFAYLPKQHSVAEESDDEYRKASEKPQNKDTAEKKSLSSVGDRTAVVSDCNNNYSEHTELENETQQQLVGPGTRDPDEVEEIPRTIEEVPSQLEIYNDNKLDHFDGCSPVQSQISIKDSMREKPGPESENGGIKESCNTDASCQVMLESYVLQLLCVQKVLMEATEKDTGKRVG